jgi:drug/metabolite transporter (DMT)-like permease
MSNAPRGAASPVYVFLSAAVATSFATGSTLAPIAYHAGSDALALNATRTVVAALIVAALLRIQGLSVALSARERRIVPLLGMANAGYSFALYAALAYVPVAMAVLIFYTYPIWTALIAWGSGSEKATGRGILALVLGLIGVGLVIGTPEVAPDWRGVALALGASIGFTAVLMVNARIMRNRDSRPVTLWMLAASACVYILVALVVRDFAVPQTGVGWLAFGAIPVFYSFAFIGLFAAVAALGPLRTALIMNFEPVASVVLGWLILGQSLGPVQLFGAALVVSAIMLAARRQPRQ